MGKCSRDLVDLLSLWQVTAFLEVVNVYCPLQETWIYPEILVSFSVFFPVA